MKFYGLKNVKAFDQTPDIELAPITIFVGQNSCGKSSLIRFPVLLTQAIRDDAYPIRLYSERTNLVDYGTLQDTLHNRSGNEFSFRFAYSFDSLPDIEDNLIDLGLTIVDDMVFETETGEETSIPSMKTISAEISYSCDNPGKSIENWIVISSYSVSFDDDMVAKMELDFSTGDYALTLNAMQYGKITENWHTINVRATQESLTPKIDKTDAYVQIIKTCLKLNDKECDVVKNRFGFYKDTHFFHAFSLPQRIQFALEETDIDEVEYKEVIKIIKNFEYFCIIKDSLDEALIAEMKSVCYIGPFRNNPERIYRRDNREINSVGKNGEDAVKLLIKDGKAAEVASKWLEDILGCKLNILPLGDSGYYQMLIQNKKTGIESNIMDVGYGISQILPIITQLAAVSVNHTADSGGNELYIIEQPELHLHPNAQASLADIFASVIKKTVGLNRTMLIETHSEHFIRGLQLLIADTKSPYHIDADQVKIYYVHGQNEDRKEKHDGSWIEEMEIDASGQFVQKWPHGFFDKSYELTKSLARAIAAQGKVDVIHG